MANAKDNVRTWLLDSGKDGGNVLQLFLGLLHLPRGLLALDLRLVGLGQGLYDKYSVNIVIFHLS